MSQFPLLGGASALPAAHDTDAAERGLERLSRTAEEGGDPALVEFVWHLLADPPARALAAALFGNSPFLGQCLLREISFAQTLLSTSSDRALAGVLDDLAGECAGSTRQLMHALRIARRRVALTTAIADIAGLWPLDCGRSTRSWRRSARFPIRRFGLPSPTFCVPPRRRDWCRPATAIRRTPAACSSWRWASSARASSTIPATSISSCSTRPNDRSIFGTRRRARFFRETHARPGARPSGANARGLRIPVRSRSGAYSGPDAEQDFFAKLTRDLVRVLQERTPEGYVFRCDLGLRPDAGATPLG